MFCRYIPERHDESRKDLKIKMQLRSVADRLGAECVLCNRHSLKSMYETDG